MSSSIGSGAGPVGKRGSASAVFDRFSQPLVAVARDDIPWGLSLGLLAIAVMGVFLFVSLNEKRTAREHVVQRVEYPAPVARAAAPTPVAVLRPVEPIVKPAQESLQPSTGRLGAPAMIVDLSDPPSADQATSAPQATTTARAGVSELAAASAHGPAANALDEETFASRVSQSQASTVYASQLHDTHMIVAEGTVVPAILETGINSDLPGFVRAVVSRDIRGFDGSTVLIPRGSKLIGQYKSAVAAGYSRAFVVWSRLLTPDAVSIDIGSPATDQLGRGGVEGETNTHFFQRFGSAILLSVLDAGLQAAANSTTNGNTTAIVIGTPQQANNVAAIALQKYIDVPTTIIVPQGTPVRVFVAHDLDFSNVASPKP